MKPIEQPAPFEPGNELKIRSFHRHALGLETDTRVFLCAMPPEKNRTNEIILTTIHPDKWPRLFRLNATLKEGRGVVASVLNWLKTKSVNIEILETLTTESNKSHELLGILTIPLRHSRGMEKELRAHLMSEGKIEHPGALQLLPLRRLAEAAESRKRAGLTEIIQTSIRDQYVHTTLDDWKRLFHLAPADMLYSDYSHVVMFSDTEEKYLSMYFPTSSECLFRIVVKHRDEEGALAAFASCLEPLRINIVNSYSRLQKSRESAEWRATLDITEADSCARLLDELQSCREYFEDFLHLSLFYNRTLPGRLRTPSMLVHTSLDDASRFVGRTELVHDLLTVPRHVLVSGYFQTGKSALLHKLHLDFPHISHVMPVYINLQGAAVSDFFSVAIRAAWDAVRHRCSLSAPPRELNAFIPADASLSSLTVTAPTSRHRLGTLVAGADTRNILERALRALIEAAQHGGWSGIALLVDESHEVLYATKQEGGEDCRDIWAYLNAAIPPSELRWIVADNRHWRFLASDNTGLLSKVNVEIMRALSQESAEALVEARLSPHGIRPATADVLAEMLALTGRQACYIQVLCDHLLAAFVQAPPAVDIVTRRMIRKVTKNVVDTLHTHFRTMYADLLEISNERALDTLLGVPRGSAMRRSEILKRTKDGSEVAISLEAIPGLVRRDRHGSGSGDGFDEEATEGSFFATPLFAEWKRRRSPLLQIDMMKPSDNE